MLNKLKTALYLCVTLGIGGCGIFVDGDATPNLCHFEAKLSQHAFETYFRDWVGAINEATTRYYKEFGHMTILNDNLYYFADFCGSDPLSDWLPPHLKDETTLTELSREEFSRRVDAVVFQAVPAAAAD